MIMATVCHYFLKIKKGRNPVELRAVFVSFLKRLLDLLQPACKFMLLMDFTLMTNGLCLDEAEVCI